ncbi:hypothetical protein [Listeria goaensis]|uniref:hypothetical protein n=1 Tax=Listeria goaensis TaxID=1649188 RepID=UPI0013563427|nr:hypothetical protein [Listeria goaensis]
MSEYQNEKARKQAQESYCQSMFWKHCMKLKPGVLAPEVYKFDKEHKIEDRLDMRLEAIASLNEQDYPCLIPVRECVEKIACHGTEKDKITFFTQEKHWIQAKVNDFQVNHLKEGSS